MNILVTGGTGFLGQHLVKVLLTDGHTVRFMGRDFSQVQPLIAAGAIPIPADLRNTSAVSQACNGVDVVYHVGALSAAWGKRADFFAINVGGTQAVIAGCREYGIKRLIYVSSPSVVFNGQDQHHVDESVPYPHPGRFASVYSLTKKLGEDLVNACAPSLETVIIRPKAIFGPSDRTLLPQLIMAARRNRLPQVGKGNNLVDLTYVENVAYALLLTLDAREAVGKTYTITNDEHISLWDVIRQILCKLGLSTNLRRVPLPLTLACATFMEVLASATGKEPLLTCYSATILARTQTYNISAAKRDLGYVPQISVAEGIERTLAALKGDGG
ncbi:MAG TPA: NAD-dependent epimerase/dehydratase family protein [Ktedonobacteraceae bacterium]|nr:NAD-dependent epimerase/dehydratase family protein [Ktedonobacteraceae bacterium]